MEAQHRRGEGDEDGELDDEADEDGDDHEGVAGERESGGADDGVGGAGADLEHHGGGVGVGELEGSPDGQRDGEEPDEEQGDGGDDERDVGEVGAFEGVLVAKMAVTTITSAQSFTSPMTWR